MNPRWRGAGGFTLLEVLIATMIIGIVAAALMPMVTDYASQAKLARQYADAQTVQTAMKQYSLVHTASAGFVRGPDGSLYVYTGTSGNPELAVWDQILMPTDMNGNVMSDPIFPGGSYTYGPYLLTKPAPAALLLAGAGGTPG